MSEMIRINKYIAMSGYCSRREADRLIEEGRVTVEGKPATAGLKVTDTQSIMVDGHRLAIQNKLKVYALYKPVGYISSMSDEQGIGISHFIKTDLRLYPVGRLDKESEGLILLTNDGELMNSILKAANAHEKEYLVTTDRKVTESFVQQMSEGVIITNANTGKKVKTAKCKVVKADDCSFYITLIQGMNRQIRRMCGFFDYKVTNLKRIRIMNIEIGAMKSGEYREITGDELRTLKNRAGIE